MALKYYKLKTPLPKKQGLKPQDTKRIFDYEELKTPLPKKQGLKHETMEKTAAGDVS